VRLLAAGNAWNSPWRRAGRPVSAAASVNVAAVHVLAPWNIHRLHGADAALVGEHVKIHIARIAWGVDAVVVRHSDIGFGLSWIRERYWFYEIARAANRAVPGASVFAGNGDIFRDQTSGVFGHIDETIDINILGIHVLNAASEFENIAADDRRCCRSGGTLDRHTD